MVDGSEQDGFEPGNTSALSVSSRAQSRFCVLENTLV